MKRATSNIMHAVIGEGFLQQLFGGKSFIHCLIELLKNSRDWGADIIMLITALALDKLRIVDNGRGMNGANRDAFVSIATPTAREAHQSGKFCTGTKQTLFSQAKSVTVRTVSDENPDIVFVFSFTKEEYEKLVLTNGKLEPQILEKNRTTWPYDFPTGTEITYELNEPKRRDIKRGEALAHELSARLPIKFCEFVQVDGKPLPQKEIVGEVFSYSEEHPKLGLICLEAYRPKHRAQDEGFRVTGVEIGEVSMENFERALGELQGHLDPLYLMREVCGVAGASFFKEHANEDRQTINPKIADDPRTVFFLRILKILAPEIERKLGIRIAKETDKTDEARVNELVALVNQRYEYVPEPPDGPQPPNPTQDPKSPLRIDLPRHEFEPGETIEARAILRADLVKQGYKPSDVHWTTHHSRGKGIKINKAEGRLTMTADQHGDGVIQADLQGTMIHATTHYRVLKERVFRLSLSQAQVKVGGRIILTGINTDKLKGDIAWMLNGPGRLEESGARAVFHADIVSRPSVSAWDKGDPRTKATCDITVNREEERIIKIRNHTFLYDFVSMEGLVKVPVRMERMDKIHHLAFNLSGLGYQKAKERGELGPFLFQAMAIEYGRFVHQDLPDDSFFEGYDFPRDLSVLTEEAMKEGYAVLDELMDLKKTEGR
jgi:hypothetical protein